MAMDLANSIFTTTVLSTFYVYHRCGCSTIGRIWELMVHRFILFETLHGNNLDSDESRLHIYFFPIPIFVLAFTIQDRLAVEN